MTTPEQYLAKTYRPDRELIDGKLVRRNLGEYEHSRMQAVLVGWLRNHEREWRIRGLNSQRIQLGPDRFRVPDVSAFSRDQPIEQVFTRPPLLCIEVLSEADTFRGIEDRVDDLLAFGVSSVWIVDPGRFRAYICKPGGFVTPESGILTVPGTLIQIPLTDLFADLD